MKFDKRLSAAADFISGKVLCDVGTDHARLPVGLLMAGRIDCAIGTDVNDGPLESGKKTAEKYSVSDNIRFIKANGLDGVDLDGVTDIVIAGMGGELIADILNRAGERLSRINLILQPMTKQEYLFEFLRHNAYFIIDTKTVFDRDTTYEIINVVLDRKMNATTRTVYDAVNGIAPFKLCAKYGDNSGLLVGNFNDKKIDKILVSLDISASVVKEACDKNCGIIVSHHPVIYKPIKNLSPENPAVAAANAGIACICAHLNFDASKYGMNSVFITLFENFFETGSVYNKSVIEDFGDNNGLGIVFELPRSIKMSARDFAQKLKGLFGSGAIKYTHDEDNLDIKRVAFCSGAGGDYLTQIISEKLADVYIASDCKHSVFIEAGNVGFPLFDCGHFATEAIMKPFMAEYLRKRFLQTEIIISEADKEPFAVV